MVVIARLVHANRRVDEFRFEVTNSEEFGQGAKAAFDHFHRAHPEIDMFSDGVTVGFGGEEW